MIHIQGLHVTLPGFSLRDIDLHIGENEFFILMGPTGSGKTLLLECIAGLIPAAKGRITVAGRDITPMPPERRGVGIVYQDYALFPHLSVTENIRYGLRYHASRKERKSGLFQQLVDTLNLSHLLKRLPLTLSGGEKQRVALARALIVEPQVILLDEPLSALDPGFREDLRHVLKELQGSSRATFLMVTHDFAEALALADRAAVIHGGAIEQCGTVEEIFQRPSSAFVADFVGMKNLFSGDFRDTRARVGDLEIQTTGSPLNGKGYIAIRPEDIVLSNEALRSSMRNTFQGKVRGVLDQGFTYEVQVEVGDVLFKALVTKRSLFNLQIQEGKEIVVGFKSAAVHCF